MKQVTRYEKSSGKQVEVLKREREILCQRVQDLVQTLELAEQAELGEKEVEIVCRRVYGSKHLLEECEINLRKRIIDMLFEFYIPPKSKNLGW